MTKRKMLIIEKASELFAERGFDATSVQDITDACGISKGAFYLSFKSKDGLLYAIFEYFSNKVIERMNDLHDIQNSPKEKLELFFSIHFEEVARYSDFILMHMREAASPMNKEMLGIVTDMRQKTDELQERLLLDVYGEKIVEHIPDLLVLIGGIIKGYIEIIVFNHQSINYKELGSYIVERTDSIIEGLSKPFLTREQLMGYVVMGTNSSISLKEILKELKQIKDETTDENMRISLEVIAQELTSKEYRKPVIIGMMSNLEKSETTKELLVKLKAFLS